jgi:TldD protein
VALSIDRRDFLRKGGTGLAAAATSSLWFDLLLGCKIPPASLGFFTERFGVTEEDMKIVLNATLSKGGEFSEIFLEYRIADAVQMEEDIIKESTQDISLGVGIRVIRGDQTGYSSPSRR